MKQTPPSKPRYRKVGFVGSLAGMTLEQLQAVSAMLSRWNFKQINHCDYRGACAQFHTLIREQYPLIDIKIYETPTTKEAFRAHCPADLYSSESTHGDRSYDSRNHRFVFESSIILAAPSGQPPAKSSHRQPVWDILRYAQQVRREIVVVWPDGTVETHYQLPKSPERLRSGASSK